MNTTITDVTIPAWIIDVIKWALYMALLALAKKGIMMSWKKYLQIKDNQQTLILTNGMIYKFAAILIAGGLLSFCIGMAIFFQIQSGIMKDIVGNGTTQKQTSIRVDSLYSKLARKGFLQ